MNILSVLDPAFQNYGQVITGYDCKPLLETLEAATPLPEAAVDYHLEDAIRAGGTFGTITQTAIPAAI